MNHRIFGALLCAGLLLAGTAAEARKRNMITDAIDAIGNEIQNNRSYVVPAAGKLEVAFSPNEGSERLVVRVIDSARQQIDVLSYSFTSPAVTEALLRARHRGVLVRIVADYRNNISEDRSGKARAALSALANGGADVRTISVYPIHHDKVICVDGRTVELGSFNYSAAAAAKNSENVLVSWDNPELAKVYLGHFERNYRQSDVFRTSY